MTMVFDPTERRADNKPASPESKGEHFTAADLDIFLKTQHQKTAAEVARYREHLAECRECWQIWNQVRWDAARGGRSYEELKSYLGDQFQEYFDSSWALANDWNDRQPSTPEEVSEFYKETPYYLYNLVIWHDSGDRLDFTPDFEQLRDQFGAHSVIDYGCGVGNDGLPLLEQGFAVTFIDFDNPSTQFLRWRLAQRGYENTFLDVEQLKTFPPADMFLAMDVLEHMVNPLLVIDMLHPATKVFVHQTTFGAKDGGRHPFHFDFDEETLNAHLSAAGFHDVKWPNTEISVWVRTEG